MALHRQKSGGVARLLAVALVIGLLATAGLLVLPSARAAWTGAGLTVAPSRYWGGHTFVPGETMTITLTAAPADSITLEVHNATATLYSHAGISIPNTGLSTQSITVRTNWTDGFGYSVVATDTTGGGARVVGFAIATYRLSVWSDRRGYLPGDGVTVTWSATYAQNGTQAPAGSGAIQVLAAGGASLLATRQYNTTAAYGTLSFTLGTGVTAPQFAAINAWFNDTAGLRHSTAFSGFGIGNLGITVTVAVPGRGYFEPGESVPVAIQSTITGIGGVREPNVAVSVNVTDQATGLVVAGYSNAALTTDATGNLNYVFQLALTPTTGTYQVTATDSVGAFSATASAPTFNVRPPPSFTATVTLDKSQYISGDPVHATVNVVSLGTQTFTYTWYALDSAGNILAYQVGGTTTYTYTTSSSYQGTITMEARVDNTTGGVLTVFASANVAFGYLSLTLDHTQFNPGDTITATAHLTSTLITSPAYVWSVQDAAGSVVASSNGSTTQTLNTPNPSSSRYVFYVTATQNGRSVQATATATRADGYFLSVSFDKSSYNPGDTMSIAYTITTRGVSVLPSSYHFLLQLYGVTYRYIDAATPTGTLTLQVPGNTPTGNLLLYIAEGNTGAAVYETVHIGAVNPLVADIGGVPLFDILITLLFVVLLLAVILLWRRTGMGRTPPIAGTGKPSTPPPPPPSGPSQQAAGPMSVACKHCGASIEITTSKRPIEVMCPSCGETQVVQ